MTPAFPIEITRHFERAFKKLVKAHPELAGHYAEAITILGTDPYNQSRGHPIKKLQGVPAGDGQYRIRAGRLRFRYDVEGRVVYLKTCTLRKDAYR